MGVRDRREGLRPGSRITAVGRIVGGSIVLLGVLFVFLVLLGGAARPLAAQGLADFDYEDLAFRGVMLDVGYVIPSGVDATGSIGGRFDLGFLGPGVRVTLGFSRWSSQLDRGKVRRLEEQMEELIQAETGEQVTVDLGRITLSDAAILADAHFIWRVPLDIVTYAGGGGSAHIMRGGGASIQGTFIEDLLSQVRAGVNWHAGMEVPVLPRLNVVGETRYELVQTARYLQFRVGAQLTWGPTATGGSR